MRCHELYRLVIARTDDALSLLVDDLGRRLTIVTGCAGIAHARKWTLPFAERDCSYTLTHTPADDHLACDCGHLLQIVLGSRGDLANCYLFGCPASKSGDYLCQQVLFRVVVAVIERRGHGDTQRLATWHNRYLRHGVGMHRKQACERMPTFMIGNYVQVFVTQYEWTLSAQDDFIQRLVETALGNAIQVAASCQQRCFIDQICQVRSHHTRCSTCDPDQVYIRSQRHIARMDFENSQSSIPAWSIYGDTAVKTARAQQGYVESIRTVGGRYHNHGLARIKTIHLHQQLVECLFAFIVGIDACCTLPTYGVDLINEDDTGRCLLCLIEEVTYAAGTHANQHFHKF